MIIYVMRHGETVANRDRRLQGWLDSPLTDAGIELAARAGRGMRDRGIVFDAVYTSPLTRAKQTCAEVMRYCAGPGVVPVEDYRIKETFGGIWEGVPYPTVDPSSPLPLDKFLAYMNNAWDVGEFPGGDSVAAGCERAQDFLRDIVTRDHSSVLVSCHGFCMRAMLNRLFPDPSDFWQGGMPANCSVSVVEANDGRIRIIEKSAIYY